ncbi:hypothetical protein [Thiocapsa roseopersicina]|uniref:Uncharacterized protein n=1 Tax=Thiocapsa roseopersicina TaxID=1058 RepID=A0A1H2Y8N5_THIRO|nr:hypothetical protein [Thiocapsa roseopersicina]SDX01582.1 hypothetical protein SAMN05421783_11296 [Thiocapsa roseopersicina]
MSGEKEVRLREGEYRRLMNAARKVESQQNRASALEAQLGEARRRIAAQQQAAQQRQRALDQTISQLSTEVQAQARAFQTRLAGLDLTMAAQRQEYLNLINEQAEQVQRQFNDLAAQRRNALQAADRCLGDAGVILDHIARHQRHEQFAPCALDGLRAELAQSQANLDVGHEQAAIATGQALYRNALKLQAEIEYRQQEWDAWYHEALTALRAQLAAVEVQQTARWVFDTDQGALELDAEIDYWSDGALSALKGRISESVQRLEQHAVCLTLADLKASVEASQPLQAELEQLVTRAKERLIASQLRANIAEDLLNELAAEGWRLEEDAWHGQDADAGKGWKSAYHLKLRDQAGDEMITIILPEETPLGSIENRVQFAYYPKDNNDARFAARQTERLGLTLARLGLTQEGLQCVPGHERTIRGDEARRDFEQVRASAPQPTAQSAPQDTPVHPRRS